MSEAEIHHDLSVANVREHVIRIATQIPTRLAGSVNGRRMAEYSAEAMQRAGVAADVHELSAIVSFPGVADLQIRSPVELTIDASTLGHSVATGDDGVAATLLDVGGGGFEDYAGRAAAGTIALVELSRSPARHEKQRIAALNGCAGVVMINWGAPDGAAVPYGSVKSAWGVPTERMLNTEMPTLPCVGIARAAGQIGRASCRERV